MKPTYQTIIGPGRGNCWHACIASILEIPLEKVPDIQQMPGESDAEWYERWQEWLRPLNLMLSSWSHSADSTYTPKAYTILGSQPPGCDWYHAVVCLNGQPIWNPMPNYGERIGDLGKWCDWTLFAIVDPAKPVDLSHLRQMEVAG